MGLTAILVGLAVAGVAVVVVVRRGASRWQAATSRLQARMHAARSQAGAARHDPGMTVFVRDAYVAGEGVLVAKLLGLLTVMEQPSTPELAQGELMRFLAEAPWYPYWRGRIERIEYEYAR